MTKEIMAALRPRCHPTIRSNSSAHLVLRDQLLAAHRTTKSLPMIRSVARRVAPRCAGGTAPGDTSRRAGRVRPPESKHGRLGTAVCPAVGNHGMSAIDLALAGGGWRCPVVVMVGSRCRRFPVRSGRG